MFPQPDMVFRDKHVTDWDTGASPHKLSMSRENRDHSSIKLIAFWTLEN